jgi:hypothetical protein
LKPGRERGRCVYFKTSQTGDQSLRSAYPLASWAIEQSTDTTQRIITLQTEDGFKVRFSIPKDEQGLLGEALTRPMPEMSVRPN